MAKKIPESVRNKAKPYAKMYSKRAVKFIQERNKTIVASETERQYFKTVSSYFSYVIMSEKKKEEFFTRDTFVEWCKWGAEEIKYGGSTWSQYTSCMSAVLRMLFVEKAVEEFSLDLPVVHIRAADIKPKHSIIPVFRDIIHTRKQPMHLCSAVGFEIMATSGIRSNELFQLTMSDITPNFELFDEEEKCQSKYAGAKIFLNARIHQIKDKKNRTTYISKLAFRLLCNLKILQDIDVDDWSSHIPVMTISKAVFTKQIQAIAESSQFGSDRSMMESKPEEGDLYRKLKKLADSIEEINKLNITEAMKKTALKRANKSMEEIKRKIEAENQDYLISRQRYHKSNFTLHGLRHFSAGLTYFRNWHGGYKDLMRTRNYLGHSNESMTMNYMDELDVVGTKEQWIKIMLGSPTDYTKTRMRRIRRKL